MKRRGSLAVPAVALLAALVIAGGAAADSRSASVVVTFEKATDGLCHPVSTASWSGYPVHHVRHIYYRNGTFATFDTTTISDGTSLKSGTLVSVANVPAGPGETWMVHAIFRTKGGGRLVEVDSAPAIAPVDCPVP